MSWQGLFGERDQRLQRPFEVAHSPLGDGKSELNGRQVWRDIRRPLMRGQRFWKCAKTILNSSEDVPRPLLPRNKMDGPFG